MAVTAYVGLPGSGKSHSVVEYVILPALKAGREVFTNIPMNRELLVKDLEKDIHPFDVQDIVDNPNWWNDVFIKGGLLVIDECWRMWPSGLKQSSARKSDQEFFAEHRHMVGDDGNSTEIIIVTQDLSQIAMFVKSLVSTTVKTIALSNVGLKTKYRVEWYTGAVTGHRPPKSALQKKSTLQSYKKEVFKYYVSHTKSSVGAGLESVTDSRSNILMSQSLYIGIAFVLVAVFFISWGSSKVMVFFGVSEGQETAQVDIQATSSALNIQKPVDIQPHPIERPHPKPVQFDFLADAKRVFIVFNNGRFPKIDYRFRVETGDSYTVMSMRDLAFMDYHIQPINQCLAKLTLGDSGQPRFIMCESEEERGFFAENSAKFSNELIQ